MLISLVYAFLAVWVLFTCAYIFALKQQIYNSVDIAYGLGFLIATVTMMFLSKDYFDLRKIIVVLLIAFWSFRIALFLTFRKYGKDEETGEDRRFKTFRDEWGASHIWKGYFMLYFPQVFFVMIVGLPAYVIVRLSLSAQPLNALDFVGFVIWSIGFLFEAIGDLQMLAFKNNPENKGKIYTKGLWKYTQHPNYFGEITMWFGLFIVALNMPLPWSVVSVIGPVFIALALLYISGVPLLKRKYTSNPEYMEYMRKTSLLIPWFPKE